MKWGNRPKRLDALLESVHNYRLKSTLELIDKQAGDYLFEFQKQKQKQRSDSDSEDEDADVEEDGVGKGGMDENEIDDEDEDMDEEVGYSHFNENTTYKRGNKSIHLRGKFNYDICKDYFFPSIIVGCLQNPHKTHRCTISAYNECN